MDLRQTINILLIEDNKGDIELIRLMLPNASFKYELYVSDSLLEGINIIPDKNIHILLLDLSLPDAPGGLKTLNRFFESGLKIPVIVLTGANNEMIGNYAVKAGAQDFLVKGQFDAKLLGRAIRFAFQRYQEVQKLTERTQQLTSIEKRHVSAHKLAAFGNWEMDMVTNEMIWSREMYRLLSLPQGSGTQKLGDFLNAVYTDDREKVEILFEGAAKDGKTHRMEYRLQVGTSFKWLEANAQVHFDDVTQRMILIGNIQDITERKQNELNATAAAILNAAPNVSESSREQIFQNLSFNSRTSLTTIFNTLYLFDAAITSPQQLEIYGALKASVDDLNILIDKLLNYSFMFSHKLHISQDEFDIRSFLIGLNKAIEIKSQRSKIIFETDFDAALPKKIIADEQKITQIISNLIDTCIECAIKENNTRVVFKLYHHANDAALHIDAHLSQSLLDAESINALLDEPEDNIQWQAQQAGGSFKNLFLLKMAKRLTVALAGKFNIINAGNKQLEINCTVPVKTGETSSIRQLKNLDFPVRILLVEDHYLNQIATKKLLAQLSSFISVDIAENGAIAVEKCQSTHYDVILMDLNMPVMNGFEATKKIRERFATPIIGLTAAATTSESERCFQCGMNDYMSKPFKAPVLYQKILAVLSNVLVTV